MFAYWSFIVLLIALMTEDEAADQKDYKLMLVQMLFRHGDRTPQVLYPTDPNSEVTWPGGLGALTLLGRRQLYSVGLQLRRRYRNFLTTNPVEIKVNSSATDRCLESCESFLASFYAPTDEYKFYKHVNWQPIPIHLLPLKDDKYLDTESDCPAAIAEQQRIIRSPEGQAYISKHKEMFDYLTLHSGKAITDWISANYLFDTLFVEKRYNLTIPEWAETYWDELQQVSDESYYWWYKSKLMHRLRGGPLVGEIIKTMQAKINGSLPDLKFRVYSAHDDNLALTLEIFDIFPMKLPPYASMLLFELYSGQNGLNFIRLLYLNSTTPEDGFQRPHLLKLHGCEEFCPLEYFISSAQPSIPTNWEKECGITQ